MKGLVNNEENVAMNIKLKEGKKNFGLATLPPVEAPEMAHVTF
jgi:hypothetical protein